MVATFSIVAIVIFSVATLIIGGLCRVYYNQQARRRRQYEQV